MPSENEALLLIDIQNDYFRGGRFPLKGMAGAARNAASLLARFREEGKPVIHIRHISREKGSIFFLPGTAGSEIHPSVSPAHEEKVFEKHYPNSFRETGLLDFLKEKNIRVLHVAGAMTNMCVDSTVRAGFDLGFSIVLHAKACAAVGFLGTRLVHRISIKTLGSSFARTV